MTADALFCLRHPRRDRIRAEGLNGLNELEVSDDQRMLTVSFLAKAPDEIDASNVRVDGPADAVAVRVRAVRLCRDEDPDRDDCMRVVVDRPGDFSTYTLRVVDADPDGRPGHAPLAGFDPRYAAIDFSFKVGCPTGEDCRDDCDCPPQAPDEPSISYLAKDYESFRQLILDRLALVMPAWRERHVPDLGITLVELLAYVGDELSYFQDAVATEAYLATARRRVSVRRHVRLVDYRMHEGCNARAWVCVEVGEDIVLEAREVCFVTTGTAGGPLVTWEDVEADVRADAVATFELLGAATIDLRAAHNRISLWTWGDANCCIERGATSATLADGYLDAAPDPEQEGSYCAPPPDDCYPPPPPPARRRRLDALAAGDVLVFEELVGPATGNPADADPRHRQAVRLTSVTRGVDELYDQPVVEVEWEPDDALTFALCVSTFAGEDCAPIADVSVARGNVVLVDHGASITRCGAAAEALEPREQRPSLPACDGPCEPADPPVLGAPYEPRLHGVPLTHSAGLPDPGTLAARQAQRTARIPDAARERIDRIVEAARAGDGLSQDDLDWLVLLLGAHALRAAGLTVPRPRRRHGKPPRTELVALERLSARAAHLLQRKARRTATLAANARAGQPLGPRGHAELAELWGAEAAAWADPSGHALWGSARAALQQDPRRALAQLAVDERLPEAPDRRWSVRADLLDSGPSDADLVVEVDDDGIAQLRFGDGRHGRAPAPGAALAARYRVGNGTGGNVPAETIVRLATCTDAPLPVIGVRNPLPAAGGTDPEPVDEARLLAPDAFRAVLQRAITAEDYAALASAVPGVQRAVARLRWTGSWYEALVGVDALGTGEPSAALIEAASAQLQPVRRIGHDLRVAAAQQVPLELALEVCVLADFQRGHVLRALRDALGSRALPDGERGMFHPDELTFGSAIAISTIVARVHAIAGVETVRVTALRRQFGPPLAPPAGQPAPVPPAVLRLGALEVAVLDGSAGSPDRGRLTIVLRGGR
ncbi:MAG TPA: putative baseplate assembly protein [Solirubrobacteraceae bacterium]|jgi:predicted phage baseplate assembly protein|nr:putative baseplate assembly protein [Solirubrobacteraceae bacterium]